MNLLYSILIIDPKKRLSCEKLLEHDFFKFIYPNTEDISKRVNGYRIIKDYDF